MLEFPIHALGPPTRAHRLAQAPLKRLLVVEDDPYFQQIIARVFRRIAPEAHVRICESHDSARTELFRARWSQKPYDMVVVDHFLPDGYGADLWKVCSRIPGLEQRVILISGMARKELFRWCGLESEAAKPVFVSKEATPGQIARKLYEAAWNMGAVAA